MARAKVATAASKDLTHRTKRAPVGCASTKFGKRGIVRANGITLVIREAVAGITGIELSH